MQFPSGKLLSRSTIGALIALGAGIVASPSGAQAVTTHYTVNWDQAISSDPFCGCLYDRAGQATYDPQRGVVVIYTAGYGPSDQIWEWNGRSWARPSGGGYPGCCDRNYASAFSYAGHGISLLTGMGQVALGADTGPVTYAWDGNVWTKVAAQSPAVAMTAPTDPACAPFYGSSPPLAAAYDSVRQRMLLVGSNGSAMETWEWTGSAWANLAPAVEPPNRFSPALSFDSARGVATLFGGFLDCNTDLTDTWEWNGAGWSQSPPAHHPSTGRGTELVYDAALGRTVAFGGQTLHVGPLPDPLSIEGSIDQPVANNETWEWDGVDWCQDHPLTSPSPRAWVDMAYDAGHRQIFLHGGQEHTPAYPTEGSDGGLYLGDLLAVPTVPGGCALTGQNTGR
jgi:hypothetical protein